MEKLENRIRKLRKEKGMSLAKMSRELKSKYNFEITPDALGKYERGARKPKPETWKKLSKFFNVPVEYIQGKGMDIDEIKFASCYIMALSALGAFNKDAQESYVFKELDDKVNYFLWLKNLTYSDIKRLNNHEKINVFEKFNKKINYDYYFKNDKQEELILKVTDYFMKSLAQITDDNFFYKLGSLLASTYDNQDFIDPIVVGKYLCILLNDCNIALENDVFNQTDLIKEQPIAEESNEVTPESNEISFMNVKTPALENASKDKSSQVTLPTQYQHVLKVDNKKTTSDVASTNYFYDYLKIAILIILLILTLKLKNKVKEYSR